MLFLHREPPAKELFVAGYVWEHPTQRPNGHSYPLACPVCNHVRSWRRTKDTGGKAFSLVCRTKWTNNEGVKDRCGGTFEVARRSPSKVVLSPYVGRWLAEDQP